MPLYLGQDDAGTSSFSLQDFEPSWSTKMNAAVRESWLESYGPAALDYARTQIGGDDAPKLSANEASEAAKAAGITLRKAPADGQYTRTQLDVILQRQRELKQVKDVRERTPWDLSSPLRGAVMFGAGIADPLNLATAFVPWTRLIPAAAGLRAATVGGTFAGRTGARAAVGALDGGISTLALEPAYSFVRNEIGDDYGALDSLANIAFGTAFGGGVHALGGAAGDAFRAFRSRGAVPLVTPEVLATARDMTPEQRAQAGVAPESARAGMPEIVEPRAPAEPDVQPAARTADELRAQMPTKRNDLMVYLRDNGGISPKLARDAAGENGMLLNRSLPGVIKGRGAQNYDQIAQKLSEDGWLPEGVDPASAEGERMAADIVSRALNGETVLRVADELQMAELRARQAFDEADAIRFEAETEARLEREAIQAEASMARTVAEVVEPETREAALRSAVAQSVAGRRVDVDAVVGQDPAVGTATKRDGVEAAQRSQEPEAVELADFEASDMVQARVDASPKWDGITDAEAALGEADLALNETVRAGGDAFKYSRADAPASVDDALDAITRSDLEDDEVFSRPWPSADDDGLTYLQKMGASVLGTGGMHVSVRGDGVREAGPHEFFFYDNDDTPIGFARLTKNAKQASVSMIAFTEDARGNGYGRAFYDYLIKDLGLEVKSDKEITEGTAGMYRSLARDYAARVDPDGRVVISPIAQSVDPKDTAPLYSRGITGEASLTVLADALRTSFGASTDAMLARGQIQTVATPADIPGGPHPGDVKAATAPDGKVYVVAENVSPAEARGILLHEVGVHVGMRDMLGPEVFDSVLGDLDAAIIRGEDWAQAARAAVPADTPAGLVREEQLAYLVENSPELPLVQRIIAAVRAWAYRNFEFARDAIELTEADFRAMAVSALHHVARSRVTRDGSTSFSRMSPDGEPLPSGVTIRETENGFEAIDARGQRVGYLQDNLPRGAAQQLDENASVDIVKVDPTIKGQGIGRALYAAFNDKHGGRIIPSGKTSLDAWRLWKRNFPERVDAFVQQEADRIRGGADARMVIGNITDAEVAQRVMEESTGSGMRYSRGETPDTATIPDELKPYVERIERAKAYAKVLRAAADKLADDAQATEAMRAALPDITPQEIGSLLDQLRRQVKGLRGMARTAADAIRAEDVANTLQPDAMKAADELANNLQMAAVIEKRNAALNINARLKATSHLNQFRAAKLDFEGFRGLLVGTERKRAGGRISVDAEQKQFRGEWLGGLIADLERGDLMTQFTSGEFDRDIYQAMWNMGKNRDVSKLPPEAVEIARVLEKYQTDARNTRNRFGAWIRDLNGYITRQSHDMFKIRDAGEQAFKDYVLPRLDLQRSLRDFEGSADDFLTRVYDDFAAGSHMKTKAGEDDIAAFGTGANLARRESVSRVLYFKDGNAAFEYNQKFGMGTLAQSVLQGLDHAAKSAGLLKILGTNPEQTVTRLFDEYAETLRGDPVRRARFLSKRKELSNLLAHVDGSVNIPGNVTAARISSFLRAWQSISKLGGAVISSITDLSNYAAELRFGQDKNLLSGTLDGIGALTQGRAAGEKKQILSSLGVFHESTLGSVFARFDNPDLLGGKMSWAMQQFFKLNGLNWWTETLRDGYALTHSHYMATNAGKAFDKLPDNLRDMLGLYNIDAGKWEILRTSALKEADGKMYMTPEGLQTVPRATLEAYIASRGRTVSDASVQNLADDLSGALRAMTIDRMHHAVIEPGARTRAFMQRGTQPGTVAGELLRFIGQFKSFPVALIQMTLGREVYGRGYDTLSDYMKRGKGDMLGLASFIALSTAMGYAAMSVKDLLRGKNPRPVDDPRTWAAAMVQGGGLGLYGDFLFGKYNRMGGSLTGSMAGPVANLADTAADLWTRIRTGDDFAAVGFNALLANTPFMSLFYTRAALDYLILYQIQDSLNPGFLRRMERRLERENGQTFYLPPSQVVR
jgi:ribosomal protein S18 acetylase RimI-like enzyme